MKRSKIPGVIATMSILAAFFAVQLLGSDADIINVLTAGTWKISGKGWWVSRVFYADGTFASTSSKGQPLAGGNWRIESDDVFLDFSDGHTETVALPLNPAGTVGSGGKMHFTYVLQQKNDNPAPTTAFGTAPAQTSPPISPEMQQKAADLLKAYHNDLVFVTGKDASGSGFIASMGGRNFLITNAHIPAGINDAEFKTLDDTVVKGGTPSVAVGRDIFCMALPAGGVPLEIMQNVEQNAAVGDDVVVLGNADGGGVINTITGKIVGIGPDRVEIDAPFVHGNSGSPIIHLKSGKVIGIASYLEFVEFDPATKQKLREATTRRFGFRVDNVKMWQAVDWRSYYAQAAEMDKIEALTSDLIDLCQDLSRGKGGIDPGQHTNPAIKPIIDQWLAGMGRNQSVADRKMAAENFVLSLKSVCQADVTAARQHMTYDYFQSELADEQKTRDAMSKAFEDAARQIGD